MTKSIIVAKVPETYTYEKKKELAKSIELAMNLTQVVVVPEEVEVYSISYGD